MHLLSCFGHLLIHFNAPHQPMTLTLTASSTNDTQRWMATLELSLELGLELIPGILQLSAGA